MATIQGVYVALFGRPADPAGLAYFNGVTNNGADLAAIANLAGQAEYTTRFENMNNAQIVNSIYRSLFNRDAEAAGLNFFVEALNNGTLSINNIAIAILDGAQGDDKAIVENKLKAADAFTKAIDTPVEIASYSGAAAVTAGQDILAGVTKDAATIPSAADINAAIEKLVTDSDKGNEIVLATGASVVSNDATTLANADKVTTDKNDTITAAAGDWTAADKIDGGYGTDTLEATVAADVTVAEDFVKSIEKFNITATGVAVVNLKEAVGVTHVTNAGSSADLTLEGLALSTVTTVKGGTAGVATFGFEGVDGTADAKTIFADAATATGLNVAGIEALTISSTGGSTLGALTAADATSITLTGSDALSLTVVAAKATSVTNTSTGKVTIDLDAAAKLTSYTGSAAVDVVSVDTNGLTANVAINTGAGNDTINADLATAHSAFSLTLTGGEGSDLFNIGVLKNVNSAATAADFEKSLVTIADFNAAQDVIDATLTGDKTVLNNVQLTNLAEAETLLAAVTVVEAAGVAAADHAIFVWKGDTYLFQNDGTAGVGAADGLVKITGLSNVDLLTAANFI
ncbi:MAG: DUF4214 domain-containing protein [Devosia sp.]|uniref:DUF4214 domain-containing protein n=1 Tax=Devosia sp. TaxID=1871048 RepID=UPI0019F02A88|nr:DUF4214 domain-containing protein [Devosia sp.]MBF0680375.1 DUF4214 domain-containing protein [Devosia sp.]